MPNVYLQGKQPYLLLKISLPGGKWKKLRCLIDTGFSGGVSLPLKYKNYLKLQNLFEAHITLADGTETTVDAGIGKIKFNDQTKFIDILFMGSPEALVGVEFLDQMIFCLDLKRKKVTLSE